MNQIFEDERKTTARLESDYSPGTYLRISRTVDADIVIGISGNKGEFRIATSGSRYHGKKKVKFMKLFHELIDAINDYGEE